MYLFFIFKNKLINFLLFFIEKFNYNFFYELSLQKFEIIVPK